MLDRPARLRPPPRPKPTGRTIFRALADLRMIPRPRRQPRPPSPKPAGIQGPASRPPRHRHQPTPLAHQVKSHVRRPGLDGDAARAATLRRGPKCRWSPATWTLSGHRWTWSGCACSWTASSTGAAQAAANHDPDPDPPVPGSPGPAFAVPRRAGSGHHREGPLTCSKDAGCPVGFPALSLVEAGVVCPGPSLLTQPVDLSAVRVRIGDERPGTRPAQTRGGTGQ